MTALKGLVLSGGKGTRLRPFTFTAAKQLVPIANKPVLFFVIEDLVRAGISDIGIVVGETADQIQDAVGDGARFGATITYIPQPAPLGLAHAVLIAEPWLNGSPFVMYLGDNFLRDGIRDLVRDYRNSGATAQILLKQVAHPEHFGVAVVKDGKVVKLVEKPAPPPPGESCISDLALVGVYMFDQTIMQAAKSISPSGRGELEITDAIAWLVEQNHAVQPRILESRWIDTGKMEDLLEANRLVLERLQDDMQGEVDDASSVVGPIELRAGSRVINSVLRGPLSIASGTEIRDSFIGPFTAVGESCVIQRTELQHSIVMDHCAIVDIGTPIESSVIGRYSRVARVERRPYAYRLTLGDYSHIEAP